MKNSDPYVPSDKNVLVGKDKYQAEVHVQIEANRKISSKKTRSQR